MSVPTDPPAHLSKAARQAWADLGEVGLSAVLREAAAVQVARMRDAQARVDAEGLVIAGAKNDPVPHPALLIERQAETEIRRLLEMGKPATQPAQPAPTPSGVASIVGRRRNQAG